MSEVFDKRKISTFRDFKELVRSNKLIGRREICIVVDKLELENVVYKAELFDDIRKENKKLKDELLKYEIQNSKLQKELVELRVKTGRNAISGEIIMGKRK